MRRFTNPMAASKIGWGTQSPAGTVACLVCGDLMPRSYLGVGSHLRSHVRRGQLAEADRSGIARKMLPSNASVRGGAAAPYPERSVGGKDQP